MVRTADSALRVAGGKASRKGGSGSVRQDASFNRSPSTSSLDKATGGLNPICHRETPTWQKPITQFFKNVDKPAVKEVADDEVKKVTEVVNMMETNSINQLAESSSPCNQEEQSEIKEGEIPPDVDMKEIASTSKKTQRETSPEDDAPRKKIKLDKNVYRQLLDIEQY